MKKFFSTFIFISIILGGVAMAQEKSENSVVIYFSRADENYGVGVIQKGNTEKVAEEIARQTGAKVFKIEWETPYPAAYRACTDEAKKEQSANARPALKSTPDVSAFDTVYVGYPNWWGDLPMPVYTFLESQNWNGKTVIPFCTHEGSGLSGTEAALKRACKGATVKKGLAIRGSVAQNDKGAVEKSVKDWLD